MAKQHNPQHNTQTPPAPAPLSSPDGSRCARDRRSGTLGCPYLPSSSTGRRRARQSRPQPAGKAAPPWAPGHSGLTWGGWRQGKRSGAVCLPPQKLALCSCSPLPTVGWGHEARTPAQSPTWVSAAASPPKKTSLECPHEPPGVKTLQLRAPPPPAPWCPWLTPWQWCWCCWPWRGARWWWHRRARARGWLQGLQAQLVRTHRGWSWGELGSPTSHQQEVSTCLYRAQPLPLPCRRSQGMFLPCSSPWRGISLDARD